MPTFATGELIGTAAAAARIGVSHRKMIRFVETGAIKPAAQAPGLRGAFMFNVADVDELAEQLLEVRRAS